MTGLFVAVPLLYYFDLVPVPMIPFLIAMFILCYCLWAYSSKRKNTTAGPEFSFKKEFARIIAIFAVAVIIISVWIFLKEKELLFRFVESHPLLWLIVIILYPLLSVYPQEFIYRKFFFSRYGKLFGEGFLMILMSSLAFSLMHIVFRNWIAVFLTFAGGLLFGWTYSRTKSMLLVVFEHALYGDFIFTIGLGVYFYSASFH